MSRTPELVMLGASSLKDGNARWQCTLAVANDNDDADSFGELPVYQALGITSLPYPKDDKGFAEAIVLPGVGGKKGVVVGGRDTRAAKIVGKMDPGDSVLHSTDPDQRAQVRVQGKKQMASLVVKGEDGKHLMVMLNGKDGKLQILAKGACIEIDDSGDISLLGKGGGGILIQGGDVCINGVLKLPGMPPGMFLMACPLTGPVVNIPTTSPPATPSVGILTAGTFMNVMGVGGYT
jgi:hypothetical protein